jgi:multidrug efflux pump subunit AcrA (membrane-fusion protein)
MPLNPQFKKKKPPVAMPLARTIVVHTETISVPIEGHGIVYPLQEIQLVPQVGGKVVFMSPALVDGGQYDKGDILIKIDPADYRIAVTLAEARVKDAESKYVLAEQESSVARSDWYELNPDTVPPPLVVKGPQLATAKARLAAERAELERAMLNLSRTILKAPFDGRISQEKVDIGQFVSPGQAVATLFSIDAAEIVLQMENNHLQWFHVPGFTPETKTEPIPPVSSPKNSVPTATRVENITVEKDGEGHIVTIEGNGKIEPPDLFFVDRDKLVIDLFGMASGKKMNTIEVGGKHLKNVRMAGHTKPRQKTRVVLDLDGNTENEVTMGEKTLHVRVMPSTDGDIPHIITHKENAGSPIVSRPSRDMSNKVIVKADIAGRLRIWEGTVVRAEGKVDQRTRMINVVVRVNQPYLKKPPLVPGMFVTVDIQGRSIENGVIIPRAAIRQGNVVWVVDEDGRLEFRAIEVALRSREGVVVKNGLSDKEHIVVSPIKEVTNGMKVRNVPANNGGDKS